jgi:CO/xanthine dehydrogenase Mo-binding subunit
VKTGEYRVVGKSLPARDAADKVSGAAKYTADHVFRGMLYAKCCGSTHPHARVRSIDTTEALAVPGVQAIITCFDVPQAKFVCAETKPIGALTDHPLCLGDEVAAVAATTLEAAEQAVRLLKVDYEVLPAVFDPQEALAEGAPQLDEEGNLSSPGGPLKEEWGDVDGAFARAAATAQGRFKTQIHVHSALEPRSCLAIWNGREVHVWSSTQFPHRVRNDVATVLDLPVTNVRVDNTYLGGGFGGKKQERPPVIAALLSQRTGRPVKLEYTREDEHIIGRRRAALTADVALACDAEGHLTGIKFEGWYDVGAYGNAVGGSLLLLLSMLFVYRFGSGRFVAWDVNTNLITAQPFRGVQFPTFHFPLEQLVDDLARQMGMDPTDFRLQNTYRTNEVTQPFGEVLSSYAVEECVSKGKEVFGWNHKWRGWNAEKPQGSKRRGFGMATSIGWCDWERHECGVNVEVHKDGSATLITGTSDLGTDSKTTLTQILAEELNLPYERVGIVTGDTAATPYDYGACASRTLFVAGLATKQAAENVREQILELAAEKMTAGVEDLYLEDGSVKSGASDRCLAVPAEKAGGSIQYLYAEGGTGTSGSAQECLPLSSFLHGSLFGTGALAPNEEAAPLRAKRYIGGAAAQFAEVEVDMETGEVKVIELVAVHDVGRAINPAVVEGQILGALVMGKGFALTEELRYDEAAGRYLEDTYTDYKIPTIGDIGKLQAFIIEADEPLGPYGAKGVGEHALNCTAGAIANAIRNAVGGSMLMELPMTPERLIESLG